MSTLKLRHIKSAGKAFGVTVTVYSLRSLIGPKPLAVPLVDIKPVQTCQPFQYNIFAFTPEFLLHRQAGSDTKSAALSPIFSATGR
jgi:hypothetical protein